MCGIAGIFRFDNQKVDISLLKRMNKRMVYRGPDDEGYYISDEFGMCMRRLAIIDIKGGKQPLFSEDSRYAMIVNGEIYNYKELRVQLKKNGHLFKTKTDTEVILHLFEDFGLKGVHQLNGMFAFALWDNVKRVLYIFRDRIGIKPLYYTINNNFFAFASNILALRECLIDLTVNKSSFLKYLGLGYIPYPDSIFTGVKKLEPGSYLIIKREKITHKYYWDLDLEECKKNKVFYEVKNIKECKDCLNFLIKDSVRLQMRSDVPVGIFLSGGLDSSIVNAIASRLISEKLNAFSVGFIGGYNELEVARKIADQFGNRHLTFQLYPDKILSLIYELIPYLDEPIADNSIIPSYMLAKMANKEGIPVILTGAGGDELFGGYYRYFPKCRGIKTDILYRLPEKMRRAIGYLYRIYQDDDAFRILNKKLDFAIAISGTGLGRLKKCLSNPSDFQYILSFLLRHYESYVNSSSHTLNESIRSLMRLDLKSYLVDDILTLTDKMSMAVSVEARVPLLDHRIVEFCFSIPEKMLFPYKKPKALLKETFSGALPEFLFNLPKSGFAGPTNKWIASLLRKGIIRQYLIENCSEFFKELFSLKELNKLLLVAENGKNGYAYSTLWTLFIFDFWYKTHIEGKI